MRYFKLGLLFVVLLFAFRVHAQEDTCQIDVDAAIALLEEARAKASDNDADGAHSLLLDAAATIDALLLACPGKIDISAEKTLTVDDEGSPIGQLRFNYPAGWLTAEEHSDFPNILIASNASALAKPLDSALPPPFAPGEVLIALGVVNTRMMSLNDSLGKSPTPVDFVEGLIAQIEATLGKASDPTSRALNDHPAAWVTLTDQSEFNLLLLIVDTQRKTSDEQSQYVVMLALTAPGELAAIEPTLLAMAETFRFSPN